MALLNILKHFTVLKKKLRILDWNSIFISCFLFTTGCVLAGISWQAEAPRIFVILYLFLASTGFVFYRFRIKKVLTRDEEETRNLLSPRTLKFAAEQQHTKILMSWKALNTEDFSASDEQLRTKSENQNNFHNSSSDTLPENVCEEKNSNDVVACIKDTSSRSVDLCSVQHVLTPVPGGNYSRKSENIQSDSPPKKMQPSTSGSGPHTRKLPTAKFYVPSPDIVNFVQEALSTDIPEVHVTQDTSSDSSSTKDLDPENRSEPIYENLKFLVSQKQECFSNDYRGEKPNPHSKECYSFDDEGNESAKSSKKLKESLTKEKTKTDSRYKSCFGTVEVPNQNVLSTASLEQEKNRMFDPVEHSHPWRSDDIDVRRNVTTNKYIVLSSDVTDRNRQESIYENLPSLQEARRNNSSDCFSEEITERKAKLQISSQVVDETNTDNNKNDADKISEKDGNQLKYIEKNVYDLQLIDKNLVKSISSAREQMTIQNDSNVISSKNQTLSDIPKEIVAESEPLYENLPSYLHAVNPALNKIDKEKETSKVLTNRNHKPQVLSNSLVDCAVKANSNPYLHHCKPFHESVSSRMSEFEDGRINSDMIHTLNKNPDLNKPSNSSVYNEISPSFHNLTYDTQSATAEKGAALEYKQNEASETDFVGANFSTNYENVIYNIHKPPCKNQKVEKDCLQGHSVINKASLHKTNSIHSVNPLSIKTTQCFLQTSNTDCTVNPNSLIHPKDFSLQTDNLEEKFRKSLNISEKQVMSNLPQCRLIPSPKGECGTIIFKDKDKYNKEKEFDCFVPHLKKTESCLNPKKKNPILHDSEKSKNINFRSEESAMDHFANVTVAEKSELHLKQKTDLCTENSSKDLKPSCSKPEEISPEKIFSKSLDCRESTKQLTGIESTFKAKCKISSTKNISTDGSSKVVCFSSPLEIPTITETRHIDRKLHFTKSSSLPSEAVSKSPTQCFPLPFTNDAVAKDCVPAGIWNVETEVKPHSKSMKYCDDIQLKCKPYKTNLKLLSISQISHGDTLSRETNHPDEKKVKSQFRRRETKSENNYSQSKISLEKSIKHSPKQAKRASMEGTNKANTSKRLSIETLNVSQAEGMLQAEILMLESDFELKELRRRSISKSPGIFPPLDKVHSLSVPKTSHKSKYRRQLNNSEMENLTVYRECPGRKSFPGATSDSMHSPVTSKRIKSHVPSSQPVGETSVRKCPVRVTGSNPDLVDSTCPSPKSNRNAMLVQYPPESLPPQSDSPKARRKLSYEPSGYISTDNLQKFQSLPLLSRRRLHLSPDNCLPTSVLKINKIHSSLQKHVTSPDTPKSARTTLGIESKEQYPHAQKQSPA